MGTQWPPNFSGIPGLTYQGANAPRPSAQKNNFFPQQSASQQPSLAQFSALVSPQSDINSASSSQDVLAKLLAGLKSKPSESATPSKASQEASAAKGFDPMMMVMMMMMMMKQQKARKTQKEKDATAALAQATAQAELAANTVPVGYDVIRDCLIKYGKSINNLTSKFTPAQLREAANNTAFFATGQSNTTQARIKALLEKIANGVENQNILVDSNQDGVFSIEIIGGNSGAEDLSKLCYAYDDNVNVLGSSLENADFGDGRNLTFASTSPAFTTVDAASLSKLRKMSLGSNSLSVTDLNRLAVVFKLRNDSNMANFCKHLATELGQTGNSLDVNANGKLDFTSTTTNTASDIWNSGELLDLARVNNNVLTPNVFAFSRWANGAVARFDDSKGLAALTDESLLGNQIVYSTPDRTHEIRVNTQSVTPAGQDSYKAYTQLEFAALNTFTGLYGFEAAFNTELKLLNGELDVTLNGVNYGVLPLGVTSTVMPPSLAGQSSVSISIHHAENNHYVVNYNNTQFDVTIEEPIAGQKSLNIKANSATPAA